MPRTLTASDRSALIRLASTLEKGSPERRAILAGLEKVAEADDFLDGRLDRAWKAAMKKVFAWKRSGDALDSRLYQGLRRDPMNSYHRKEMLDLHEQYAKEGKPLLKDMEAIIAAAEKHPISKQPKFREAKDNLKYARKLRSYDPYDGGWNDPVKKAYQGSFPYAMLMATIEQLAFARDEAGLPQGGR